MNPIGGKTCPICKTGVSRTQAAQAGHCGAVACRTAFAVEHQKARAEDMLAAWHASAADVAAQAGMRVGGAVPRQTAPLERPDPDRIAAFRAHLRRIVMASLFENSDEAAIAAEEATASRMDAAPVVAAGCATCRGRCCSMGAPQQAFLTVSYRHP